MKKNNEIIFLLLVTASIGLQQFTTVAENQMNHSSSFLNFLDTSHSAISVLSDQTHPSIELVL